VLLPQRVGLDGRTPWRISFRLPVGVRRADITDPRHDSEGASPVVTGDPSVGHAGRLQSKKLHIIVWWQFPDWRPFASLSSLLHSLQVSSWVSASEIHVLFLLGLD
jgi:hypothetical protein